MILIFFININKYNILHDFDKLVMLFAKKEILFWAFALPIGHYARRGSEL